VLRSADELLGPAVKQAIADLPLAVADSAAVKLAERYAAAIDSAANPNKALATFGPKLLAALAALQATPAARSKWRRGRGGGDAGEGRLQALRAAR